MNLNFKNKKDGVKSAVFFVLHRNIPIQNEKDVFINYQFSIINYFRGYFFNQFTTTEIIDS